MPTNAFFPIEKTTITSAVNTFTFSSIPDTYQDLFISFVGIGNGGGNNSAIRFNGDTGSNYGTLFLRYNSSSRDTAITTGSGSGQLDSFATLGNGVWTQYEITIPNYANANVYKMAVSYVGLSSTTHGGDYTTVRWNSTSAINSITLISGNPSFSFQPGTTMSLYGIGKA